MTPYLKYDSVSDTESFIMTPYSPLKKYFILNIFQGWIFFRGEYFSVVNIFWGWIFLGWMFFRVNIFLIWIFPSEDSHSLLGLVFTFIQVWKQRSRRCWFLHDQLVLTCNLQIWKHSSLGKCVLSYTIDTS